MRGLLLGMETLGMLALATALFLGISMFVVWFVGRITPLVPGRGRRRG